MAGRKAAKRFFDRLWKPNDLSPKDKAFSKQYIRKDLAYTWKEHTLIIQRVPIMEDATGEVRLSWRAKIRCIRLARKAYRKEKAYIDFWKTNDK